MTRWRSAAALLAALALTEAALFAAATARPRALLDVGPSTGRYLSGFTESEERPPLTFRWTRRDAAVALPLQSSGGEGAVTLRVARFLDTPAVVRVFASGRLLGSFVATPGGFRIHRVRGEMPAGPLRLQFTSASLGGEDLGVAVDWVRAEGPRFRLGARAWGVRVAVALGFFVLLLAGWRPVSAALLAAAIGMLAAAWAAFDPVAAAHASGQVALPAASVAALAAAVLWRAPERRWVVALVLAAHLLRGAGLFHPSYFYPDVRNFGRYALALKGGEGWIAERGRAAQEKTNTAYPRYVGGRAYAFPYSPVFFLPFTLLPADRAVVEGALKHAALAAASLEVVAVFLFARAVATPSVGVWAALVSVLLPPLFNRLLFAMFATVAGHLVDVLALWAAAEAAATRTRRAFLRLASLTLLSLLTYISSLFNLTALLAILATLRRRLALPLLAIAAGAAAATVLLLYLPFTVVFLREIVPAVLAGDTGRGATGPVGLGHALSRIPLFYGWALPLFTVAGVVLARRRASPERAGVVLAYALAVMGLVVLRGLGAGLFKDLKEIEFATALVALGTGACLDELASSGRGGRLAAAAVVVGLLAFGVQFALSDLARHTPLVGAL